MEQKEKKTKILVVDDDPVIRGLIKSIFMNSEFDINEADSGEMALEILPNIMPDIILLDIIMSGMDGFEVLKAIRSDERLKYIRIILLSSKSDINERLKGYGLGTDDYMTKPFVGNELLAKVNVFAKLKHSEERNLSLTELVESEIKKRMEREKFIQDQERLISMSDMIISIAHYWRQPLNALGITVQDIYDAYTHNELTEDYLKERDKLKKTGSDFKIMFGIEAYLIDEADYKNTRDFYHAVIVAKDLIGLRQIFSLSSSRASASARRRRSSSSRASSKSRQGTTLSIKRA